MRTLILLLAFVCLAAAQTSNFPASLDTDANLKITKNGILTSLRYGVQSGDSAIAVNDCSRIEANMLLTIARREIVNVVSVGSNCSLTVTRGFDGTTAIRHASGAEVGSYQTAYERNVLKSAVLAIETALGPNLANVGAGGGTPAVLLSSQYDFSAQTPGGSLVVGANSVTMAPVPAGVNGTNASHKLWVSGGTGAAEACTIIGGSAVGGQPSGTLIVQCANAHSGAWTIRSATAGVQEALYSVSTQHFTVQLPAGDVTFFAPVAWPAKAGVTVQGSGNYGTVINQGAADISAFVVSGAFYATVRNLVISGTGTSASGYAIDVSNCPQGMVEQVRILSWHSGVKLRGTTQFSLRDIEVRLAKKDTGVPLYIDGNGALDINVEHFETYNDNANAPYACLQLVHGDSINITDSDFVGCRYGALINPTGTPSATSGLVAHVVFQGTWFDSNTKNGVLIEPTGGAAAERIRFSDCWFNASEEGLVLKGSGGSVDRISLLNSYVHHAGYEGIAAVTATNLQLIGNSIFNNSVAAPGTKPAIYVGGSSKYLTVLGNVIGSETYNTHLYSLMLDHLTDHIVVTGNQFEASTGAIISDNASGMQKVIKDNTSLLRITLDVSAGGSIPAAGWAAPSYRLTTGGASPTVTTMTGGWYSREVLLTKNDAGTLTLSATGVAGSFASDYTLPPGGTLVCYYDWSDSIWFCK